MQKLSSDFEQLFLVKKGLCIFKEQIWLPNRKCHGKIKNVTKRLCHCPWSPNIYMFEADWMSSVQDMTYYYSIIAIFLNFYLSKVK